MNRPSVNGMEKNQSWNSNLPFHIVQGFFATPTVTLLLNEQILNFFLSFFHFNTVLIFLMFHHH